MLQKTRAAAGKEGRTGERGCSRRLRLPDPASAVAAVAAAAAAAAAAALALIKDTKFLIKPLSEKPVSASMTRHLVSQSRDQ